MTSISRTSEKQAVTSAAASEQARLKHFWNSRYSSFSLSESGWMGAGEDLNRLIYACKLRALKRSVHALTLGPGDAFRVLDAGCGQGIFARFYRETFPRSTYVGIDISDRAIAHLRASDLKSEFHVADIASWIDPANRKFDVIQSFEVLDMILDDDVFVKAIGNLSARLADGGSMLITAAMIEKTFLRGDYLRYRSEQLWLETLHSCDLEVVSSRPMYYWLPAGGPSNRYLRFGMNQLGVWPLYALDRAALALRLPQPGSMGPDSRMRLLTVRHAR
jgi:SAM-dependent methyltransferase